MTDRMRKFKEFAIEIIKSRGTCNHMVRLNVSCLECPLANGVTCTEPVDVEHGSAYTVPQSFDVVCTNRYERALKFYVKHWGKEDIVEALL